ncbi:MAG: glycerol-3-phosphate dehydrogenase/oxidase [Planctomycetes bacterium]|nr:glycerol-3-phosphate dehydrogenase/oxidase [Planctomycetota bacterium]
MELSHRTRRAWLHDLRCSRSNVLVIGGGITGAGIALDAASRGLSVGLLERGDFASGTSGKSSKLIHGGLRYLRQLQFKVTIESSRERTLLMRLAPSLVRPLRFVIPMYGGTWEHLAVGTGLSLYGFLGNAPHEKIDGGAARELLPGLLEEGLKDGFVYQDAQTDDCRLVLNALFRSADFGARFANYVEVLAAGEGRVLARDRVTGEEFEIAADHVVNAAGVWVDGLRRRAPLVRPSKGAHLVLRHERLPVRCAAVLASAGDRRIVFVIPWSDVVLVGTTDTDYQGSLDHPRADAEDVRYLLDLLNRFFPSARIRADDLVSTYAGLRPLLAASGPPSRRSRKDRIAREHGVWVVTGGKLTTYRRMAKRLVDRITRVPCRTQDIPLDRPVPADVQGFVDEEMALTAADVIFRRTHIGLLASDRGRREAARIASLMPWATDFEEEARDYDVPG